MFEAIGRVVCGAGSMRGPCGWGCARVNSSSLNLHYACCRDLPLPLPSEPSGMLWWRPKAFSRPWSVWPPLTAPGCPFDTASCAVDGQAGGDDGNT